VYSHLGKISTGGPYVAGCASANFLSARRVGCYRSNPVCRPRIHGQYPTEIHPPKILASREYLSFYNGCVGKGQAWDWSNPRHLAFFTVDSFADMVQTHAIYRSSPFNGEEAPWLPAPGLQPVAECYPPNEYREGLFRLAPEALLHFQQLHS
jgi:hypothetical protein